MTTWVEIVFHSSCTPKRHANATRVYVKAESLCVELAEVDPDGRRIVVGYPLRNVFSWSRPHPDHVGATLRSGGEK